MSTLQIVIETLKYILPWFLGIASIFGLLFIYFSSHKNSGFRGVVTYLGHLIAVGLGWLLGRWFGIILISVPILLFYYYLLFHLALVVVPVSDPDSWNERWQRFWIFVWYQWGVQYPLWIVSASAGRDIETRIPGTPVGFFAPGLVLARSHQVVGFTKEITISRTLQSGLTFTHAFERPLGVVDLRTQLRTSWIDVISSDGILYRALLFTAFAVDKEKWNQKLYHELIRENPLLKDAREPDCTEGSYPFSRARLYALFNSIGESISSDDPSSPKTISWDERVLFQVEKSAREILSQRRLDELWQPKDNQEGANAMDEIADAIKDRCSFQLRLRGVNLYSSRIVSLSFTKNAALEADFHPPDLFRE